ncbi:MAG: adenosylmethionine--8-amino-7-oxononanoate transaminase [Acidiferrobacterales bacterium]|nr:adenosylmethionine--8-amino-7-oxononanoate transaminase [Acidiferrobacterales bacterium]
MNGSNFDQQHLWHPYSAPPSSALNKNPVVKEADGVYLRLEDDTQLIDAMSSWWCVIHGYNHPHVNAAVKTQVDKMAHVMFGGLTHQPAIELGKELLAIVPNRLNHIFYSDSGSVAVEVALKMAVQYQFARGKQRKHKFLTVRSGYHGDTWKAMSVSDPDTGMHHLFSGALQAEYFVSRPPIRFGDDWDPNPNNNGIHELSQTLVQYQDQIGAIILEPIVQGAGGMYFYHPEYLNACRKLCDEYDVLLIFDEIATGFGRTGELFASDHCAIQPDIICLGKALTAGYLSFAATLCTDDVAATIGSKQPGTFMHGPTFMANPLACSAAIANLQLLSRTPWQDCVQRINEQLITELSPALHFKNVSDVRAIGAIGVIEMRDRVDPILAQSMCRELGVWLRPFGHNIYCMPPYVISPDQLSQVSNAMLKLAYAS